MQAPQTSPAQPSPIINYLKKYGQRMDSEIAAGTGLSLAKVRASIIELAALGEVSHCSVTKYNDGKEIKGTLCRILGYTPPKAPGRKPGS